MATSIPHTARNKTFRILELYSGLGGMHCAMKETGLSFTVVRAIDVNTNANTIYRLNFPGTEVSSRGIEGLTVKELDKLDIDMILMSPPCQPFTRVGKKQDTNDARTRSFLHLLQLIPRLKKYPSYILLENVKGFEVSETRNRLIEMLEKCRYIYQEMLLTPLQFGIPNSRLRYYLTAKLSPNEFVFDRTAKVMEDLPNQASQWMKYKILAQKTQLECVCQSYNENFARNPSVRLAEDCSNPGSQTATVHDQLERVAKPHMNDSQSQFDSEARSDNCSDCVCVHSDTSSLHQKNDSDEIKDIENNDGQAHSCAKRLKTDARDELEACDKEISVDDETANCDLVCSKGAKLNSFCAENYGLNMRQQQRQEKTGPCLSLYHFLENCKDADYFKQYNLPCDMLQHFIVMDIVNPCSRKSACFTKGYGKFVNGAGSIFQMARDIEVIKQASLLKDQAVRDRDQIHWTEKELGVIRSLQLRHFTPREIANILCLPNSFSFPTEFTNRQLYMVLGNSLNVHVVSILIKLMVAGETGETD